MGMPVRTPSYRQAVAWVALNDNPGEREPAAAVASYLTVGLVADLFDVPQEKVAADVVERREAELAKPKKR